MVPSSFLPPRRVRKQTLSVLFSLSILLQLVLFAACSSSEESAKETASAETKVDDGTNATDNTSSKVDFETVDDFSSFTHTFSMQRVVFHNRSHTLCRTITNTNHATCTIRLTDLRIPHQYREPHITAFNRLVFLGILIRDGFSKHCGKSY